MYIDFSTNDLNTYLNKNSEFIHKKYEWLYHYLKKEKLIKKISQYIDEVEDDFQIADQREPYENTDLNFSKSFRNEIDNLKRTEDKILDILEKRPNSSWSKNDTGIALVLYDYTPLHDLTFYFDKSSSPEWLGIDLNNDKKISKEEPIFYLEQNTKKINLPITLYANRIKKTDNSSKIGHDLEVNFTKTKINFISNNNSNPSRIFAKNFFTKKEFEVKQLKIIMVLC